MDSSGKRTGRDKKQRQVPKARSTQSAPSKDVSQEKGRVTNEATKPTREQTVAEAPKPQAQSATRVAATEAIASPVTAVRLTVYTEYLPFFSLLEALPDKLAELGKRGVLSPYDGIQMTT